MYISVQGLVAEKHAFDPTNCPHIPPGTRGLLLYYSNSDICENLSEKIRFNFSTLRLPYRLVENFVPCHADNNTVE